MNIPDQLKTPLSLIARWGLPLGIAAVAIAFYYADDPLALLPKGETRGMIYADSPEIYTRERLVNDRYVQDGWLRGQLERLDKWDAAPQLQSVLEQLKQVGGDEKAVLDKLAISENRSELSLAPADEFKIRNAARELIRQEMIENQLDDRHDLAGNTMFMLKIDAAVVPGSNTHSSAIIEAILEPPQAILDLTPQTYVASIQNNDEAARSLEQLFLDWQDNLTRRVNERASLLYMRLTSSSKIDSVRFRDFKRSVEIDGVIQSKIQTPGGEQSELERDDEFFRYAALYAAHAALEDITGEQIPTSFSKSDSGDVASNFLFRGTRAWRVAVLASGSAVRPPKLVVQPIVNTLVYTPADCVASYDAVLKKIAIQQNGRWKAAAQQIALPFYATWNNFRFGPEDNSDRLPQIGILTDALQSEVTRTDRPPGTAFSELVAAKIFEAQAGQDTAGGGRLDEARRKEWESLVQLINEGAKTVPGSTDCRVHRFNVLTARIEFVKKLLASSSFTYSVLPKYDADVDLIESGALKQLDLQKLLPSIQNGPAIDLPKMLMASREAGRQMRSRARLIGYGLQRTSTDVKKAEAGIPETVFGWIIVPGRDVEDGTAQPKLSPVQKSLSALVSVPVWWPMIRLKLRTGWIDASGAVEWTCSVSAVEQTPVPAGKPAESDSLPVCNTAEVRLPTDWQSIDDLILGEATRVPIIDQLSLPEQLKLQRCQMAEIEIPGIRLWRSTVVTLGGQPAEKITVLPNMRGVLAQFNTVQTLERKPQLKVWTSEGAAVYPGEIILEVPANMNGKCPS